MSEQALITLGMTTLLAVLLAVLVLASGHGVFLALLAYAFGGSAFLLAMAGSAHLQAGKGFSPSL